MVSARELDITYVGTGPRVVLVHGSVIGRHTWHRQAELAEHWALTLPNRPGFGASPSLPRGDFEAEAPLIAELLGDGAHLVGHSYGAVIALYAAALRPEAVRSLTVSEPGCFRVAASDARVAAQIANGELLQGARLLMSERPPWEADPPLSLLRTTGFAKLVISGGHSSVFEAVCDAVADGLQARRTVIAGRGHTIPATGAPYNEVLHAFLTEAEQLTGSAPAGASQVR